MDVKNWTTSSSTSITSTPTYSSPWRHRESRIAFLDIDVYRRHDDSLGHGVYGKPTHTNLFQNNGYSEQQILQALNPPKRAPPQHREDPASVAFLPSVGTTFNCRVLSKHNISSVGLPPRKLSSLL
jgi:hypothetical protein